MESHMKIKTLDEILLDYHEDRNFNYHDIRKSMGRYWRQGRSLLFPLIFKRQQWKIWECLMSTEYTSTGSLSELTGIPSKNLTTQLHNMAKTGLVVCHRDGKLKSWKKID